MMCSTALAIHVTIRTCNTLMTHKSKILSCSRCFMTRGLPYELPHLLLLASNQGVINFVVHNYCTLSLRLLPLKMTKVLLVSFSLLAFCNAFTVPVSVTTDKSKVSKTSFLRMSELEKGPAPSLDVVAGTEADPMEEEQMDAATRLQMEKARRADELRAQEVFMTKSTGIYKCNNCDWEYDETKGDKMMIGGMVKPGTKFEDLASNWRCPVCRASKDSFTELVEEIPGFAVNQGYGFGTNSWTAGQKNLAIFGGLGLFFILFLSGYALS